MTCYVRSRRGRHDPGEHVHLFVGGQGKHAAPSSGKKNTSYCHIVSTEIPPTLLPDWRGMRADPPTRPWPKHPTPLDRRDVRQAVSAECNFVRLKPSATSSDQGPSMPM
eukprot:4033694-Pyramimonas_sp.AAC.1